MVTVVPREVFELDNDERWQARLEEARARREVALREKADKPPKKRLKPWETEFAVRDKPIEPIVQEREDDRVDFADRVDTMRAASRHSNETQDDRPRVGHNSSVKPAKPYVVKPLDDPPKRKPSMGKGATRQVEHDSVPPSRGQRPPSRDEFDLMLSSLPPARPVQRDLQLILPDAPSVEDIARRNAASLRAAQTVDREPRVVVEPEVEAPQEAAIPDNRRRRPIALIVAVSILALNAVASEAPPLTIGPKMPVVSRFVYQPALGVTWSLRDSPAPTQSGEWTPLTKLAPVSPPDPGSGQPAKYAVRVTGMPMPDIGGPFGSFDWSPSPAVNLGTGLRLYEPSLARTGAFVARGGADRPFPSNAELFKRQDAELSNIPARPRPSVIESETRLSASGVTAPPEPLPLSPLKVTVLSPAQSDLLVAIGIAEDLPLRGHGEVRVLEVDHSISERNIRYYHDADRAEAARLAKIYDAELRDFTWYEPKPIAGTTEIWLPGKGADADPGGGVRPPREVLSILEPPEPQRVFIDPEIQAPSDEPKRSLLRRLLEGHVPIGATPNSSGSGGGVFPTLEADGGSAGDSTTPSTDPVPSGGGNGPATTPVDSVAPTGGATAPSATGTSGGTDPGGAGSSVDSSSGTDSVGGTSTDE